MTRVPLGVSSDDVTLASVQLAAVSSSEESWRTVGAHHTAILEHLREQPGVFSAGSANFMPMEHGWRGALLRGNQPTVQQQDAPQAQHHSAAKAIWRPWAQRWWEGRFFTSHDTTDGESVLIVNKTAADRYYPGESAVGKEMRSSM